MTKKILFLFSGIVLCAAQLCAQSAEIDPYSDMEPPGFKPEERTFLQKSSESLIPAFSTAIGTFPLAAMNFDKQAGQKTALTPKRLFKGLGTSLLGVVPSTTILTGANQVLVGDDPPEGFPGLMMSGFSGVMAAVLGGPIELLITQQRFREKSLIEVYGDITRHRGVAGLTQGMPAAMMSASLIGVGLFSMPSMVQTFLPESMQETKTGEITSLVASGVVASFISHPFDATRGYLQRMNLDGNKKAPGVFEAMQELSKTGPNALWKGLLPRAGAVGLSFVIIDSVRSFVVDRNIASNRQKFIEENRLFPTAPMTKDPVAQSNDRLFLRQNLPEDSTYQTSLSSHATLAMKIREAIVRHQQQPNLIN